ncbi:MAG: ABC transporter ATP-binding protein [Candidatus Nitrosoabyssus spongiisocia]|nr:MAG: ABC transporter ATP-binding protein [Nitrosopumilaceae archaeon AB1(1)]
MSKSRIKNTFMSLLEIQNLSTSYNTDGTDVDILDDINLSINFGESLGIAGESACGKSTLGLSIIRMLTDGKITSGDILLDGVSILQKSDSEFDDTYRWKKISMIFQGAINSLNPVFTIKKQMYELLNTHKYPHNFDDAIRESLKNVNLDDSVLDSYPHELSGGMIQRVVIAMAIILKPQIIIADEPTTSLDVLIQAQIINLFKKLKRQGVSIILITHDLGVLSEISEKIAIMYAGRIVEFGPSSMIYSAPQHPYTQELLASIPKLEGPKPLSIPGTPPNLADIGTGCRFAPRCKHVMEKCNTNPPNFKVKSSYSSCWLSE